jgi:hypothetical protein
MPRLTTKSYKQAHNQLRRLWLRGHSVVADLSVAEQHQLFDYFWPSRKMTDRELLIYRKAITLLRPSLPQQAGRALSKLYARLAARAVVQLREPRRSLSRARHHGDHHISVRAVVRPEVDVRRLVRAILAVADGDAQDPASSHGRPEDGAELRHE